MLPHTQAFVKNFFQVFSNFFLFCGVSLGVARALGYITTTSPFCKALFSTFFKKLENFQKCSKQAILPPLTTLSAWVNPRAHSDTGMLPQDLSLLPPDTA